MRSEAGLSGIALLSAIAALGCVIGFGAFLSRAMVRGAVRPLPRTSRVLQGAAGQPPLCGKADDKNVRIPSDWTTFVAPEAGRSYTDQAFGCVVQRLTDGSREEIQADGTHPSLNVYYSTFSPINAADSMLLIASNDGAWRVVGTDGKVIVSSGKMPTMNNGHPVWDATDGNAFYYTLGNALKKATVGKASIITTTDVHKFSEYKGIVSPDAADLSEDGDHIALVGQKSDDTMDVFVWSLKERSKVSVYATTCKANQWGVAESPQPGCVHKLLLTSDNELAIDFTDDGVGMEQGVRLWDGTQLKHLQDKTNHIDVGYDLDGDPVFIGVGRASVLSGETNPCPSGWGLDVREIKDVSSATCLLDRQPSWHVSYRGGLAQPWAVLSFFDDRKESPELFRTQAGFQAPSARNWQLYEDEIMLVSIDGSEAYRLAYARSRSAVNYGATPRAAISRDGKYVAFTSNMAHPDGCPANMHVADECTDVYLIKVH